MKLDGNLHSGEIPTYGKIIILLLLVAVVFLVYSPALNHDFISYDDPAYVTENSHVQAGLTYQGFVWAFTSLENSNWHPVTWLSHMLDCDIYGLTPAGHHLTNIIFHAANTVLLFILFYYTTRKYWNSMFLAVLFALHPLHVQSVAWVAERKDLVSGLFWTLTLLAYSSYARSPGRLKYAAALAAYAVGLMAKPMLVTLPFVMLLWDFWPLDRIHIAGDSDKGVSIRTMRRLLVEKIPFLALSLASCIITYHAQMTGGAVSSLKATPLLLRIVNALTSYFSYMAKMLWPNDLAVIYPLPQSLPAMQGVAAAMLLLAMTLLLCRTARRHPYLPVGWLWFLGTLVPVIGIVQVGMQSMADRYTYIPLTGLFIMACWGVPDLARVARVPRRAVGIAAGLVLMALAVCSRQQLGYWKNSVTLFGHAAEVVDGNYVAYRILGNNLARQGDVAGAMRALTEAVRINPEDEIARTDLGVALAGQNRVAEAAFQFDQALIVNPAYANAHYNLGIILARQKRYAEAIGHYLETLKSEPGHAGARANMAAALFKEGRIDEAIAGYREALRLDPGNATIRYYLELAIAAQRQGR